MNIKDLGNALLRIAPAIGSALLGPAGGLAVSAITSIFGGSKDNLDEVYKNIMMDPDHLIKLRQIESDHEIELQAISVDALKAEIDDRKNARKLNKDSKYGHIFVDAIALTFIIGYFIVISLMLCGKVSFNEIIFTALTAMLTLILSYYFGTSRGEQRRNA